MEAVFNPALERRRSQRVSESVPLVVRGIDLLGNPFEERTATQNLNLQGCRYFSTHHTPRNSWISLQVGEGLGRQNVRARVAWIHRPHSIRELFQVAIELEGPANIWGLPSAPESWGAAATGENLRDTGLAGENEAGLSASHIPSEASLTPIETRSSEPADPSEPQSLRSRPPGSGDAAWRARLAAEMVQAQRQWEEILQSSIDRNLQRLSEQLPERAQQTIRTAEEGAARQAAEIAQMLATVTSEAQNLASSAKAAVDQEICRVREVAESTRTQLLDRIAADLDVRIAPYAARVPELLGELAGREERMDESLRLHRERLRQVSENALRETAAQTESAVTAAKSDLEAAQVEALAKWSEQMDLVGARAAQAAGDAMAKTAEWFQQETRDRMQLLGEQTVLAATTALGNESLKASAQFLTHLEGQSVFHLAQVHQQIDDVANELTGRTRTQLEEAAEAAAAGFGQVLHEISDHRAEQFSRNAQSTLDQNRQQLEQHAGDTHAAFQSDSLVTLTELRQQTARHLESAVSEAQATLANESAAALEAHRHEHNALTEQYSEGLKRISGEAETEAASRIETAADAWTVASVRRLNEHGQNVIESLMRSADQALRESASRIFENLANALREQGSTLAASAKAAAAGSAVDPAENYAPTNDNFAPTTYQPEQQFSGPASYQQE